MKYWNNLFAGALAITLLSACGGGGDSTPAAVVPTYSGLTTAAGITATNAEVLSTTATDASEEAIAQNTAKAANPFGIEISAANSDINPLIIQIANQIAAHAQANLNLPTGITISATDLGNYFCGGSVTTPDNFGANNTLNGTITLSNVCYNDGGLYGQITINGTLSFTQTVDSMSIRFINFSVTGNGLSETINMTVACTSTLCSISADFEGSDGKTYRIADLTVTGTNTGPYSISATFYHPDYGYATIVGTGIVYACPNGYPSAGTINISGASGSTASITFTSCDGYSGTWNNGTTSGTFDGTWL